MLLHYHIGRFVLGSLCIGDLVRLGLSSARVAAVFSLQHGHYSNFTPGKNRYLFYRTLGGPQGRSGRTENLVSLQHGHYSNPAAPNLQHTTNREQNDRCGDSTTQSQAPDDGYINVRNMLST